ncbi:MAG: hypothetical protein H7Y38_04455 [Armatimonadetes bacterium]|nr:hypothetical protein [Armatimonadota bacterium]
MRTMYRLACGIVATSLAVLANLSYARAATLAEWLFAGASTTGAKAPSTVIADTSVSTLNRPTPSRLDDGTFFSSFHSYAQNGGTTDTLTSAITQASYAGFTITPSAGFTLNLTDLSTWVRAQNDPKTFALMSSLTGFAPTDTVLATSVADGNAGVRQTADLTSPVFQGVTTPVEFRWYIFHPSGSGDFQARGFGNWDNNAANNMILTGTVASAAVVPETGTVTLALGGLALLGGVVLPRRAR